MSNTKTVVIAAAGLGTRLNLELPKSLIKINGKTILSRQLELLKDFDDIRIVVGYKADEVINHATKIRKDLLFIFNNNYANTTPLNSLYLATHFSRNNIIYIDGDLLLTEQAIKNISEFDDDTVMGISKTYSSQPVCVEIENTRDGNYIKKFTRSYREFEWTGLLHTNKNLIKNEPSFVYQVFEKYLPIKALEVDVCEIDTKLDLEYAKKWIKKRF
jgi:choline kinase